MNKLLLLLCLGLFPFFGFAQEFSQDEGFSIAMPKVNASLSFLAPEFPVQRFVIPEVDIFKKNIKREVDMMAMMEQERREKSRHIVELDAPVPALSKGEKSIIQISNGVQMHNRGSNYDIYTGEKKIPAYKEMRAGLFNGYYSPYVGGRYYSPYSRYSPYSY